MGHEFLIYLSELLGVIIAVVTVSRFLYYTKSEVNAKIEELRDNVDERIATLLEKMEQHHSELKEELVETKEKIFNNIVDAERNTNKVTQEIYDRLSQNKQVFDDYNRNILEIISQVKQEDKQLSNEFIKLLSEVKDELKSDYINRYNDLIKLIQTKVGTEDFEKLEGKFDKIIETITELKTIVQIQMSNQDK